MFVRLFGSPKCRDCLEALVIFHKLQVPFEYVDAFDDDTQELCDEHDIDHLPHIQFVEDEEIIMECTGPIEEDEFIQYLTDRFPNY